MENTTEMPPVETEESQPSAAEQLRNQSATVRQDLRDLGRLSRDVAHEKLGEARRVAGDAVDKGRSTASDLEHQLADYVREKPLTSLMIAAGAGALIGMLWSRR